MNIVRLIEKKVDLTRIGDGIWRGLCPFHNDTGTPNFTVYEKTNSYYCFACEVYGDIRTWIREFDLDEEKYNISKDNINTYENKDAQLALKLSKILREKRQKMPIKEWFKEVSSIYKKLRRGTDEQERREIYQKYFGN